MGKLAGLKKAVNKARATAQKNATLPKSKGGLDLPADNPPMDRAVGTALKVLPEVVF